MKRKKRYDNCQCHIFIFRYFHNTLNLRYYDKTRERLLKRREEQEAARRAAQAAQAEEEEEEEGHSHGHGKIS